MNKIYIEDLKSQDKFDDIIALREFVQCTTGRYIDSVSIRNREVIFYLEEVVGISSTVSFDFKTMVFKGLLDESN